MVREFILSRHKHLITAVPVISVITLGTPNLGSGLAKFASYFCGNIQMDDLKPGREGFLDSLNERWRERFLQPESEQTFRFSAGYEIAPVNKLMGRIVEKDSAVYFAQQTQGFLKDHAHIAKPYGESDPLFLWMRQQLLRKAPDPRVPLYDDAEVKRFEEIIDELQNELKGTDLEEALNLISQGKLDAALTLLSENEGNEDEQILKTAKTRFAKAQVYALKLDYKNALQYFEKAVQLAPENPLYQNEAGVMANTLEKYDKAIEYYEKALASDLKTFGPDHANVATYWNNLGMAWNAKGQHDKAISYHEKGLASGLQTLGPEHPKVAIRWNNLGLAWKDKGKLDKAIEYYEKALESDLKTFGPDHPQVAVYWNNLGEVCREKGQYDVAIGYYEKALASDLKSFGGSHPNVARGWNNLGAAWDAKGEFDKAIGYYEKAQEVNLKTFGPEHPCVAATWNNLGAVWHAKGQHDQAIEYF